MLVRDKLFIASNLIAKFGSNTTATMEAIVDEHMDAGDMEDAAFWREIAEAVRVLQRLKH